MALPHKVTIYLAQRVPRITGSTKQAGGDYARSTLWPFFKFGPLLLREFCARCTRTAWWHQHMALRVSEVMRAKVLVRSRYGLAPLSLQFRNLALKETRQHRKVHCLTDEVVRAVGMILNLAVGEVVVTDAVDRLVDRTFLPCAEDGGGEGRFIHVAVEPPDALFRVFGSGACLDMMSHAASGAQENPPIFGIS